MIIQSLQISGQLSFPLGLGQTGWENCTIFEALQTKGQIRVQSKVRIYKSIPSIYKHGISADLDSISIDQVNWLNIWKYQIVRKVRAVVIRIHIWGRAGAIVWWNSSQVLSRLYK